MWLTGNHVCPKPSVTRHIHKDIQLVSRIKRVHLPFHFKDNSVKFFKCYRIFNNAKKHCVTDESI